MKLLRLDELGRAQLLGKNSITTQAHAVFDVVVDNEI